MAHFMGRVLPPERETARGLVARLRPVAKSLGCEAEPGGVLEIVKRGTGAELQRAASGPTRRTTRIARPSWSGSKASSRQSSPGLRKQHCGTEPQARRQGEVETSPGRDLGKVKEKLTTTTAVGGQKVNAADVDPRYVIESEKSGKEAAHKPDSLSKL
jgi:hypothetical protein